ncbi:Heme/copper-type cytochrome/quinol oxidase [Commensalibacter communis]|uniref:Ubiquinol oxidase subunit 2 n=2 Tax=Commensalibacter communis TaxID=2972786 RepID=A0A9W4TNQ2_9PROT|nr:Heme/copper-type cytochrome/quinol oxidase [Commensalibacter communis]CAI3947684.1 Heme/copper-type cytochrome/quinol oxidase [Commensalibacter communis]CAI3947920.1 Heme/copper-type cytochrome/quinol oxidase [Commensalibacter communis]
MSESTRHRMKKILPKITLSVVGLASTLMLGGCNLVIMDPKGTVGQGEKQLIIMSVIAMLCIVIPVIIATLFVAYRYRRSNTNATYAPKWDFSTTIEILVWGIPMCLIAFLAYHTYVSSHELDPYKPIAAPADNPNAKPINVQVVALNWKWLFIYPDYGIATVNEMAMPVNTPVAFRLTSDATMNSFWIPQLGSQVYVMAGMQTQLHLMSTSTGTFRGLSNNYSGSGYSEMKFKAISTDQKGFDEWVEKVKASSKQLDSKDSEVYKHLREDQMEYAKTHEGNVLHQEPIYYGTVGHHLFDDIVGQYNDGHFNVHNHGNSSAAPAQSNDMHSGE